MAKQNQKKETSKETTLKNKEKSSTSPENKKKTKNEKDSKTKQAIKKTTKETNQKATKSSTPKQQTKSTPNTRSNSLKNKLTRQNTFGRLDLLEQQSLSRSNSIVSQSAKQKAEKELKQNNYDNEEISLTPTFG